MATAGKRNKSRKGRTRLVSHRRAPTLPRGRVGRRFPASSLRRCAEIWELFGGCGAALACRVVDADGSRAVAGAAGGVAGRRGRLRSMRVAMTLRSRCRCTRPIGCGGERAHPPGEERSEEPCDRRAGRGEAGRPARDHARYRHPKTHGPTSMASRTNRSMPPIQALSRR